MGDIQLSNNSTMTMSGKYNKQKNKKIIWIVISEEWDTFYFRNDFMDDMGEAARD